MITKEFPISTKCNYSFEGRDQDLVFFDIETTGFSAQNNQLYLIGCCYFKNSSFHIIQWFAEDPSEEISILNAFFNFLGKFTTIIHFNGSSFDMPYILKKCAIHGLDFNFDHLETIDIYRKTTPYKNILKLTNYKLKTIERFLNIERQDEFSGRELIGVYLEYIKSTKNTTSSNKALDKLLLHNEDDLKGLLRVAPILSFSDIFEKPAKLIKHKTDSTFLVLTLQLNTSIIFPIEYKRETFHFKAYGDFANLKIRLYTGVLKYFYSNYEDYYYLPKEDVAVHKSLATFMDRGYKQKAKASTCYSKKKGLFIPQYEAIISPYLQEQYNSKPYYLEVNDLLIDNHDLFQLYINHIMKYIPTTKPINQ